MVSVLPAGRAIDSSMGCGMSAQADQWDDTETSPLAGPSAGLRGKRCPGPEGWGAAGHNLCNLGGEE